VLVIVLLVTFLRLLVPKNSNYNTNSHEFTGIIINITTKDDKVTLTIKNKEKILASTYQKLDTKKNFPLGTKVIVTGKFQKPSKNTTKNLFNYQNYLKRKNIFYTVQIETIKVMKKNRNPYYFLKQKVINHFHNNPYLYTFILGDKSLIQDEVKRSYQENGISHLFAISGMHITLLVSLIEKILSKTKIKEENLFKVTILILTSYLFLVGCSPSILRGVLFYFFFSLNRIYYTYIKPINLCFFILAISLLINPNFLFDIGFQYSYLISFGIIIYQEKINSSNYFHSLLKTSIYSFFLSLPITMYNFYQINLLSIFYNLLFVPLVSFIIFPFAILTSIFTFLTPIFNVLTSFLENLSLLLNKISFATIIFKRIPGIFYIFYLILILYILQKENKKVIFFLLIILFIHYLLPSFDTSTYLKMLDVGQGDAILLHSKNKNILVDTGGVSAYSFNDGSIFHNTLNPFFKSQGIKKLDYLILTHGDKDHLGEAKTLLSKIPVNKIILNTNTLNYYERKLISKQTIIGTQDYAFQLNDLYFQQLNFDLEDENDSSQIYLVQYKNIKILLTGDASIKSESYLLKNYNLGHIDILKVGHHGSKTSTSNQLLQETTPSLALISAGRENKFNHPHPSILERLKKYKVNIYNTQRDGTITINLKNLQVTTDN